MFTEIMRYQIAEGVTKEHLLDVCAQIHDQWMKDQPGFIEWEINHLTDNTYVDMVCWASKEDADAAKPAMQDIPAELSAAWQSCYDMSSVTCDRVEQVGQFG